MVEFLCFLSVSFVRGGCVDRDNGYTGEGYPEDSVAEETPSAASLAPKLELGLV